MIKLTNKEASMLLSPVAQRLFTDHRRPFPTRHTFMILDLVNNIESRIELYRKQTHEVIEKYNGVIKSDGSVACTSEKDTLELSEKLRELNDIQLEYPGELLTMEDWPKLSVQEAMILKPLLKG